MSHQEPPIAFVDQLRGARRVVFLLDASSAVERALLRRWIADFRLTCAEPPTVDVVAIPPSRRRRNRPKPDPRLEPCLAREQDVLLAPLRVAWLPEARGGVRAATFYDLLMLEDPRDPGILRQIWLSRLRPDRLNVVVAEPALSVLLRERWQKTIGKVPGEITGFADFVVRQAFFALERAERALRGARYKVPRFIHDEILARPDFRSGVIQLARETGRSEEAASKKARRYLNEIAASHSPFVIDLLHLAIGFMYRRAYSALLYDRAKLKDIYQLAQRHPIVFLPTHRSNLDHLLMQYILHENGHPPNHAAGGINMNFFPVGPLVRRAGVFFIRRSFKDNLIYKFVLRQYIDHLIEKRFPLEWYMEGGRSRSGKLLPPRFGMMAYVVDAFRRGKSEDVILVPVSIAYDQISDVQDYVAEQRGGGKPKESFTWMLKTLRGLGRRYGEIHVCFGEPLSVQNAIEQMGAKLGQEADAESRVVQKIAFDVAVRVNRVTPITGPSLITLTLLGTGDQALTLEETMTAIDETLVYVEKRGLPLAGELGLRDSDRVRVALRELSENGIVASYDDGFEPLYGVGPDQHHAAGYYRNTIIHFFVNAAIVELALLAAADRRGSAEQVFWDEAMRLRDLFKFEFFFPEKDVFRGEVAAELALHEPTWQTMFKEEEGATSILRQISPLSAHRVVRSLLESYGIVADSLTRLEGEAVPDENGFLTSCLSLGRQYRLQRRIRNEDAVSKVLFSSALKYTANQQLMKAKDSSGSAGLLERRRHFSTAMRLLLRRVEAIQVLDAGRRSGVI